MVRTREHDTWISSNNTVGSGGSASKKLEAQGSTTITGIITRSQNFSVTIYYLDNDGNRIGNSEQVLGSGSGTRQFSEDAHSDEIEVEVNDEASSSGDADINVKLR